MSQSPQPLEALGMLANKYQQPNAVVEQLFNANFEFLANSASIKNFLPILALRLADEQLRRARRLGASDS